MSISIRLSGKVCVKGIEVEGVFWAVEEIIGEIVKVPVLKVNCS